MKKISKCFWTTIPKCYGGSEAMPLPPRDGRLSRHNTISTQWQLGGRGVDTKAGLCSASFLCILTKFCCYTQNLMQTISAVVCDNVLSRCRVKFGSNRLFENLCCCILYCIFLLYLVV